MRKSKHTDPISNLPSCDANEAQPYTTKFLKNETPRVPSKISAPNGVHEMSDNIYYTFLDEARTCTCKTHK